MRPSALYLRQRRQGTTRPTSFLPWLWAMSTTSQPHTCPLLYRPSSTFRLTLTLSSSLTKRLPSPSQIGVATEGLKWLMSSSQEKRAIKEQGTPLHAVPRQCASSAELLQCQKFWDNVSASLCCRNKLVPGKGPGGSPGPGPLRRLPPPSHPGNWHRSAGPSAPKAP